MTTTATPHKHACPDYGLKHCYSAWQDELTTTSENSLTRLRRTYLNLPHDPAEWEDPMVAPLGDVAVAAIIRCHVLMSLVHDVDPMLSALAAGMVRASQLLDPYRYLMCISGSKDPCKWGLQSEYQCDHWESSVAKCAVGQFMSRVSEGNKFHFLPSDYYNSLRWGDRRPSSKSICSTVSHHAYLQPNDVASLRKDGLLVKPSEKRWFDIMRPIAMLMPNGMAPVKMPRLWTRHRNTQNDRDFPLIPVMALSLLEYASGVLPMAAANKIMSTAGVIREAVSELNNERYRYALWVAGCADDVAAQMHGFDLAVADMFDSMTPGMLLYRENRFPSIRPWQHGWSGQPEIPRTKFLHPPWRSEVFLTVPNVIAPPKSGVFFC